jgi:GT2 family glycosyltransferase
MPSQPQPVTATVLIATFSLSRWDLLVESVESVQAQTRPPLELIICIDHNAELLRRCEERWSRRESAADFPIEVVPNRFEHSQRSAHVYEKAHGSRRRFGAGSNRNTGAELARGDILVFLDDDAVAAPTLLEYLLAPFEDRRTVAVGGAPVPRYETGRPRWFPANFDWVFGCAYAGMPEELAPYPRLIGANLSVRRDAFNEIGGFHSVDFDDLDLCLRLAHREDANQLMYEPRAIVHHFVPIQRVSWQYFWRRCFFVNREKVEVFAALGEAADMGAESQFVGRAITAQLVADATDVLHGRFTGLSRMGAMLIGILMAATGHLVGRFQSASRGRLRQIAD